MITQRRFTDDDLGGRPAASPSATLDEASAGVMQRTLSRVEQTIGNHPVVALGAALSLGVVLGWLTKRR